MMEWRTERLDWVVYYTGRQFFYSSMQRVRPSVRWIGLDSHPWLESLARRLSICCLHCLLFARSIREGCWLRGFVG